MLRQLFGELSKLRLNDRKLRVRSSVSLSHFNGQARQPHKLIFAISMMFCHDVNDQFAKVSLLQSLTLVTGLREAASSAAITFSTAISFARMLQQAASGRHSNTRFHTARIRVLTWVVPMRSLRLICVAVVIVPLQQFQDSLDVQVNLSFVASRHRHNGTFIPSPQMNVLSASVRSTFSAVPPEAADTANASPETRLTGSSVQRTTASGQFTIKAEVTPVC